MNGASVGFPLLDGVQTRALQKIFEEAGILPEDPSTEEAVAVKDTPQYKELISKLPALLSALNSWSDQYAEIYKWLVDLDAVLKYQMAHEDEPVWKQAYVACNQLMALFSGGNTKDLAVSAKLLGSLKQILDRTEHE